MTIQEKNTSHHFCELRRTQMLSILTISVQIPQLAAYPFIGNFNKLLHVEGSAAWFYGFPHTFSLLFEAYVCFDRIPINYQDTVR